jgi:tetraacyldisaccharide 4'-kinase
MLVPLYHRLFELDRRRRLPGQPDDLKSKCIIVVGNLTVGGSGKTPLLIRLCTLFQKAGLNPGVISRGYGRTDDKQRLVVAGSNPDLVGDEPLLIAEKTGAPVVVGPDRVAAARELFRRGVDLVISDDGLQHHALPRAIEICVVDGERGFGNGFLLPAGPLREGLDRLQDVDYVVINGGDYESISRLSLPQEIQAVGMEMHAGKVHALGENLTWRLSQFRGCKVTAVAGISNPGRFFDMLRHAGIEVVEKSFPDHHAFTANDFESLPDDLPVIMTEKDAVKCKGLTLRNCWFLSVGVQLPADWEQALLRNVIKLIDEH